MGRFRAWSARLAACAAALAMALAPSITNPAVVRGFDPTLAPEIQERLFSGFASFEMSTPEDTDNGSGVSGYTPRGSQDCGGNLSSNVRVNQGCLNISDPDLQGRAQAQNETSIAINPNDSNQIITSQNDYRRGDGNCYSGYSTDSGRTWNDSTVPMSFTRGRSSAANFGAAREYWEAGGDTSVAWDSKGNAYLSCQVFQRGRGTTNNRDLSSALLVFRSQNHGASWNFPGRYVRASADVTGTNLPPFLDKQLLTVDNNPGSPFQDRVYVSWTEFAADGSAYIYEAFSSDYGEHFSPRHLVSATSSLCTVTFGQGTGSGNCNENQFSQPFTGKDGKLYVVYANFNNALKSPTDNRNQMLLAKSVDGGNTFLPPVKVADYFDLPDCAAYQQGKDAGRACVPEKSPTANSYFRAANYPSGAVDPTNPARVVVSLGSYINKHSNEANGCVPTGVDPGTGNNLYTGVKTPGACNNDILISVSNDAGATFTGTTTDPRLLTSATPDAAQATTDQFWQWLAFTKNGKLAISYYDRQYGSDETTGFSDVSLSGSGDLTNFVVNRVTSSSMPPPTQFGGLFFGDYTGLAADTNAHPFWMDTRNPDLFTCGSPPAVCTATLGPGGPVLNDQDVYTANLPVPSK